MAAASSGAVAASAPISLRSTRKHHGEKLIKLLLALCALVSIVTTLGIVVSLLLRALEFFAEISPVDFFTGTTWGIGRLVARAMLERKKTDLELVAVNDLVDAKANAYLFKYDSVHGQFPGDVKATADDEMSVNGKAIKVLSKRDPSELPWRELGVEIVVESTGLFTVKKDGVNKKGREVKSAENHITKGGAKKVIISSPAEGEDLTVVLGVNDNMYDPAKHHVVSNASCTTNGLAPAVKVVYDKYGIVRGFMTTIHAYTIRRRVPGNRKSRPGPCGPGRKSDKIGRRRARSWKTSAGASARSRWARR